MEPVMKIAETYREIRKEVPENVTIVAAVKTRSPEEVMEFIGQGALISVRIMSRKRNRCTVNLAIWQRLCGGT